MRQLVFVLQFRGKQTRWTGRYKVKTAASDQTWRTALAADGVRATVEPAGSVAASCEAEMETVVGHGVPDEGEGTFTVSGSIRYGNAGKISFQSLGQSVLGPSGVDGLRAGAVIWRVTGGEGRFAGATGLITSNFSVTADGQLVDNQCAQLFVPIPPETS